MNIDLKERVIAQLIEEYWVDYRSSGSDPEEMAEVDLNTLSNAELLDRISRALNQEEER